MNLLKLSAEVSGWAVAARRARAPGSRLGRNSHCLQFIPNSSNPTNYLRYRWEGMCSRWPANGYAPRIASALTSAAAALEGESELQQWGWGRVGGEVGLFHGAR